MRLAYVAMTRARDRLVVSLLPGDEREILARRCRRSCLEVEALDPPGLIAPIDDEVSSLAHAPGMLASERLDRSTRCRDFVARALVLQSPRRGVQHLAATCSPPRKRRR